MYINAEYLKIGEVFQVSDTKLKLDNIEQIHQGEFMCYYELNYKDDEGKTKTYEMVSKQGSRHDNSPSLTKETLGNNNRAVILLVFNKDHSKMLLLREFRLGVNRWVYNEVAGLIDEGETVEQATARELKEETGLDLIKIIDELKPTFTCAPVTDDITTMIICEADGEIKNSDNEVEQIESNWYTKNEMKEVLDSDDTIMAGRAQAYAYMWVKGNI